MHACETARAIRVRNRSNPFGAGAHGTVAILNGWEVSGVTTIQSGLPFSVTNAQSNLDW